MAKDLGSMDDEETQELATQALVNLTDERFIAAVKGALKRMSPSSGASLTDELIECLRPTP